MILDATSIFIDDYIYPSCPIPWIEDLPSIFQVNVEEHLVAHMLEEGAHYLQ
jgi:hypothetical protein